MIVYHPKTGLENATKEDLKMLPGFVYTCSYKVSENETRDLMICGYGKDTGIVVHGYEKRREQEQVGPFAGCTKETVVLIENEKEKGDIKNFLKAKEYGWSVNFS